MKNSENGSRQGVGQLLTIAVIAALAIFAVVFIALQFNNNQQSPSTGKNDDVENTVNIYVDNDNDNDNNAENDNDNKAENQDVTQNQKVILIAKAPSKTKPTSEKMDSTQKEQSRTTPVEQASTNDSENTRKESSKKNRNTSTTQATNNDSSTTNNNSSTTNNRSSTTNNSSNATNETRNETSTTSTTTNEKPRKKHREATPRFPLTKTSGTIDVTISCASADVSKVVSQFVASVTVRGNGELVATITEKGVTRSFDLDSFDIASSINVRSISFSRANSITEDILGKVVTEYRRAVVKRNIAEDNYACYYGRAEVTIPVEHTCRDGSKVSMNSIIVTVNKDTVEDLGRPINAITVIALRENANKAQNAAQKFASSIAEHIASARHRVAMKQAQKRCYVENSSEQNNAIPEDSDLLEEDGEDLLESGENETERRNIISGVSNTFLVVLENEDGEEESTRTINFTASLSINPRDKSIKLYVDGERVDNILYNVPYVASKATQAEADKILQTLTARELANRATILQLTTGSYSYSIYKK